MCFHCWCIYLSLFSVLFLKSFLSTLFDLMSLNINTKYSSTQQFDAVLKNNNNMYESVIVSLTRSYLLNVEIRQYVVIND